MEAGASKDFSEALLQLKEGFRVSRKDWNGLWVALSPSEDSVASNKHASRHAKAFAVGNGGKADVLPCFVMKTSDGKLQYGWQPTAIDMTATDWVVID